jgi:hypothetical protein
MCRQVKKIKRMIDGGKPASEDCSLASCVRTGRERVNYFCSREKAQKSHNRFDFEPFGIFAAMI